MNLLDRFGNGGFIFMVHVEQMRITTISIGRKYGFMSRIAEVFNWDEE